MLFFHCAALSSGGQAWHGGPALDIMYKHRSAFCCKESTASLPDQNRLETPWLFQLSAVSPQSSYRGPDGCPNFSSAWN